MDGDEMQIDPQLRGDTDGCQLPADDTSTAPQGRELGYNPQLKCGYDPQLYHDRFENKNKLRRRFEHIFEKYERDFAGIGDEIDLATGQIVIDNGHVKNMQHEADPGGSGAAAFVRAITQDLGHGSNVNETLDSGSEGDAEGASDEEQEEQQDDEDSSFENPSSGDFSTQDQNADSATSIADDSAQELGEGLGSLQPFVNEVSGNTAMPPEDILERLPILKESMLSLQSKYKQGESIDEASIKELGMTIANQLAQFMSGGTKHGNKRKSQKKRNDRVWRYPPLPVPHEAPSPSRSPSPLPELFEHSPGRKSIWAPTRHARPMKRLRSSGLTAQQPQEGEGRAVLADGDESDGVQFADRHRDGTIKKCHNCNITNNNVWRKGPNGELCNSCGMYYYRYGLMRPLRAPWSGEGPESPDVTDGEADPLKLDSPGSGYSANTSRRVSGVRNVKFTTEEDALLITLKELDRKPWDIIAVSFPGRSAYAVQCRYSKKLHGQSCDARKVLEDHGYQQHKDPNGVLGFWYRRGAFTDDEDRLLVKLRGQDCLKWEEIATSFQDRTQEDLEHRFEDLVAHIDGERLPNRRPRSSDGERPDCYRLGLRYTVEEDDLLIRLREVEQLSWTEIGARFPRRNALSLQKRYTRDLSTRNLPFGPSSQQLAEFEAREGPRAESPNAVQYVDDVDSTVPMKRCRFTQEEDKLLLQLRDDQRLDWDDIEKQFIGRTAQALRNRYAYRQAKGLDNNLRNVTLPNEVFEPNDDLMDDVETEDNHIADSVESTWHATLEESLQSIAPIKGERPQIDADDLSVDRSEDVIDLTQTGRFSTPCQNGPPPEIEGPVTPSWEQIVARMPSVSDRHHQQGQAPTVAIMIDPDIATASPVPNAPERSPPQNPQKRGNSRRWTKQEVDLLGELRAQGVGWADILPRFPNRSLKSLENYYSANYGKNGKLKPSAPYIQGPSNGSTAPLLKKALDNSLRRQSQSLLPSPNLNDANMLNENDSAFADGAQLPTQISMEQRAQGKPRYRQLLPNLMPRPEISAEQPRYGRLLPSPMSPPSVQGSLKSGSSSERAPQLSGQRAQASTDGNHEVGNVSLEQRSPKSPQGDESADYPETPVRHSGIAFVPIEPIPTPNASYQTPARHSGQNHPYFIAPPIHAHVSPSVESSLPNFTTNANPSVQPEVGVAKKVDVDSQDQVIPSLDRRTPHRSSSRTATNTHKGNYEPRRIGKSPVQPRSRRTTIHTSSAEAQKAHDATYELDQMHVDNNTGGEEQIMYESMDDDNADEGEALDHAERTNPFEPPNMSFVDLISMALESAHPRPLQSREIYAWFQGNYAYFKNDTMPYWRDRIRSTLSTSIHFKKIPYARSRHQALWAMSGTKVVAPKSPKVEKPNLQSKQQLKRPPGRPRKNPPKPHGPPRKRGRPAKPKPLTPPPPPRSRRTSRKKDFHVDAEAELTVSDDDSITSWEPEEQEDSEATVSEVEDYRPGTADSDLIYPATMSSKPEMADTSEETGPSATDILTSDSNRDPESTPQKNEELTDLPSAQLSRDLEVAQGIASSSSPILTKGPTPSSVHGKMTTPGTGRSTLFGHLQNNRSSSLRPGSRLDALSRVTRSSSLALPGSTKRLVETPLRDLDGSEDELAL